MSVQQAFKPEFNFETQVKDLKIFVREYFAEVERSERGYIEIYNHLANEFGKLQHSVMLKMD